MSLHWDWETRGEVDLPSRGPYVYAQHRATDALLASFKLKLDQDQSKWSRAERAWVAACGPVNEVGRWKRGEPEPSYVRAYVLAGGEIKAHNAAFERLIWWNVMVLRYGWARPAMEQFRCTAVTAAAMSLPRSLDRLGAALGLVVQKDKAGKELMKIHSIPMGFVPDNDPLRPAGEAIWHPLADDPESLEKYHCYCDTDVLTEEEADGRLIPLSDAEMRVYWLNETINDRGLRIDVESARAAMRIAAEAKRLINEELATLTGKQVTALTQTAKLKAWIEAQGVVMPSMDKDDVDEFLTNYDDLPACVRRALELRQEGAKPSVDKIAAMLKRVCGDGRARGVYLHHGAGQTGRFSSRGVQAHNMPKYRKSFEKAVESGKLNQETLFETIRSGDPLALPLLYGPDLGRPMHILSDAVRGCIWAAPGKVFLDADYSSIEGRMGAWFAGEDWKLEAFSALDRGEGHGIYEMAAAGIYGVPVETVTKAQRPTGKVAELSCMYQTGAGGIRKFARQNKVKLSSIFPALWDSVDQEKQEYVEGRFRQRVAAHDPNTDALGREGWIAAELIKMGWRAKHPKIVASWKALEDAAIQAVESPGRAVDVIGVKYLVAHGFLWCRLPSGRCLAYGAPKMREVEAPWADKTLEPEKREKKLSLTARGTDAQTEKWTRFSLYGGSLFNNVVQGAAADVLRHGMFKAEEAGFDITLHTHDEVAVEEPVGSNRLGELEAVLCDLPAWTAGLPLTASGWIGKRYRKD